MSSIMKTRQDNDITDCIGVVYVENEIGLQWANGTCAVYTEIGTELSWPIEQDAVYHRN